MFAIFWTLLLSEFTAFAVIFMTNEIRPADKNCIKNVSATEAMEIARDLFTKALERRRASMPLRFSIITTGARSVHKTLVTRKPIPQVMMPIPTDRRKLKIPAPANRFQFRRASFKEARILIGRSGTASDWITIHEIVPMIRYAQKLPMTVRPAPAAPKSTFAVVESIESLTLRKLDTIRITVKSAIGKWKNVESAMNFGMCSV